MKPATPTAHFIGAGAGCVVIDYKVEIPEAFYANLLAYEPIFGLVLQYPAGSGQRQRPGGFGNTGQCCVYIYAIGLLGYDASARRDGIL
jgi:hypothetical protein